MATEVGTSTREGGMDANTKNRCRDVDDEKTRRNKLSRVNCYQGRDVSVLI